MFVTAGIVVGVGVGVPVGVAVRDGVGVRVAVGVGVSVTVGVGVTVPEGAGDGEVDGMTVGVFDGAGDGLVVGAMVGLSAVPPSSGEVPGTRSPPEPSGAAVMVSLPTGMLGFTPGSIMTAAMANTTKANPFSRNRRFSADGVIRKPL